MASNRWSLQWLDQRLRSCMISSEGPSPSQIFPHLLACLCPRGTGGCLLLTISCPRGQSYPICSPTLGGNLLTEVIPLHINVGGCLPGLLLPCWGVPWGTVILPCHHLFSCVPCPSAHEADCVPPALPCFLTLTPSAGHGRWAHHSGSLDPTEERLHSYIKKELCHLQLCHLLTHT